MQKDVKRKKIKNRIDISGGTMKNKKKQSAEQINSKHNVQHNANAHHNGQKNKQVPFTEQGFMNVGLGNEGIDTVVPHHKEQHHAKRGLGAFPKQEKPAAEHKAANEKHNWQDKATASHKKWNNNK
jgi:hypothetical protein